MTTANSLPIESVTVQVPPAWLEFAIIGLAILFVLALFIVSPRRRSRSILVTDVLR